MIELHLHLDGSLRPATVLELAKKEKIPLPSYDLDTVASLLQVSDDCVDLTECLKKFDLPIQVLQTPDSIRRAVYELVEDLAKEAMQYAEIRFAPQFHCTKGASQKEIIEAACLGLKEGLTDCPHMKAALILCCMRGDDNEAANLETVRLAKEFLGKGVVAIDLAGAESLFPTENFESVFALARSLKVPFTIHAGESEGPESVWKALSFGPARIGHGVLSIYDDKLVQELADRKIPLEVSFTSNVQTKAFPTAKEHSIKKLFDRGVRVTINSDNRTVSNTNYRKEVARLKEQFGFTDEDIKTMEQYAREAAFTEGLQ